MFQLNSVTLRTPKKFNREQIEIGSSMDTLTGKTVKDIMTRKERYILTYDYLTNDELNAILGVWDDEVARTFECDETSPAISTSVHIEIKNREYKEGPYNRTDIVLILTEVE